MRYACKKRTTYPNRCVQKYPERRELSELRRTDVKFVVPRPLLRPPWESVYFTDSQF
jgi:hypothetical protein